MNNENQNKDIEKFLLNEIDVLRNAKASGGKLFASLLFTAMTISMSIAVFLGTVDISNYEPLKKFRKMDVSFLMQEKKKPEPVKKVKKPKKKIIKKASVKKEEKGVEKIAVKKKAPRKVYGVRKVYSRGLGSGYGGSNAVVAKLGNSLDVPPDTVKATKQDLKGELVSVTKISAMPKILKSSKPEYTTEMKDNQISGKVKAKVLVDVDGLAKKIIIVKDLGYGTKQSSIKAIRKMKFKPGTLDNAPVAVWIPLTFRFELQA